MKTLFIALISTLVMFNGANAQTDGDGKKDKPCFIFKLGEFQPGKLPLEEVKRIKDLKVFTRCPKHQNVLGCCGILEFKLVLINKDGRKFEVINKGPYLNAHVLYLLAQAKVDDEIIVVGVALKCHDRILRIPAYLRYKIVNK